MNSLLLSCKQCGAPIEVGPRGALLAGTPRILLDAACAGCGKRALYQVAHGTAKGS